MTAVYPRVIRDFSDKPGLITNVMAVDVNDIQDEVLALEGVIGINPLHTTQGLQNPPVTLADRLSSFETMLAKPVFSSWIGGLDDIAHDITYSTHYTTSTSYESRTSWGAYEPFGITDSPDNYPGGKYGEHPSYYPPRNPGQGQPIGYGFEWNSQSEYNDYMIREAVAAGGAGDAQGVRFPVTTTQAVSTTSSYTTAEGHRDESPTDSKGIFTLPKPPPGYDPLGWYNGSNGFVVKKTGWYHLTGTAAWKPEGEWNTTRRLTIFGNDIALARRDVQGNVGSSTEHKSVDYIGIVSEGTLLTLGIRSFTTANPSLGYRAMSPRLSGIFLRGV